jgi:hypothetical protein
MSRPVAKPDTVTLDALLSAIRNAVDSGRIGTPVNVRLHWQFSETGVKHAALVAVRIADEALALEEPAWRVRASELEAAKGRILNVLGEDRRGRTLLATLCRGEANEFALTVFGNHGTLRLEHAGLDATSLDALDTEGNWRQSLVEAIG